MEKISNSFQNTTKLDESEEIDLLKNMAVCYYNLQLYEDAIEYSNLALNVD
jgi:tetratricopeptide (TPR) repeat protein